MAARLAFVISAAALILAPGCSGIQGRRASPAPFIVHNSATPIASQDVGSSADLDRLQHAEREQKRLTAQRLREWERNVQLRENALALEEERLRRLEAEILASQTKAPVDVIQAVPPPAEEVDAKGSSKVPAIPEAIPLPPLPPLPTTPPPFAPLKSDLTIPELTPTVPLDAPDSGLPPLEGPKELPATAPRSSLKKVRQCGSVR